MASCGSAVGDTPMNIIQGGTYRRAVTYTENDSDGVQVVLDAVDYFAQLVIRRGFDAPVLLELDSTTDPELSLSTDAGSVVVNIELGSQVTSALPVGTGYRYSLRIVLIADTTQAEVLLNDVASVRATAFDPEP
jgi:hypothetical protein